MNYQKISITIQPRNPWVDVFIDELSSIGCDSFEETEQGFIAYLPSQELNQNLEKHLIELTKRNEFNLNFSSEEVASQNWNEIWESSFEPIIVEKWCSILAPFHENIFDTQHTIIINPKMSFGTGHHETTFMMIEIMKNLTLKKKKVLDMGTGTGILAILSKKMGAEYVEAIDIEPGAIKNCLDNAKKNSVELVVKNGGKEQLDSATFDVILANINRNILLDQMSLYSKKITPGGKLLLSGFLIEDEQTILKAANKNNLEILKKKNKENWLCLVFVKK
jgi:ribosomal protein L11 methyltransferase